jgi:iron(III) transport system substrate-binding protein
MQMDRESTLRQLIAWLIVALSFCVCAIGASAAEDDSIIRGADQEGLLRIYTNTHKNVSDDLLGAFHKIYPRIRIDYNDLNAAPLYQRFRSEVANHKPTADFVWSSAMDLQVKLINDGFALTYSSPERRALPSWVLWRDQGYGITTEPVVFVYNKSLISQKEVPKTHTEFEELLHTHPAEYRDKVATYDPLGSEVGMLFLSQDIRVTRDTWDLVRALGPTAPTFYSNAGEVIQHISDGTHILGYNVMGSYALEWQKRDPRIGVVFPKDYILLMSRIAFIPVAAAHPNAAKLFLDFLLSPKGQILLSQHSMMPVRDDVPAPRDQPKLDPFHVQVIQINASLLSNLDRLVRIRFARDWARALGTSVDARDYATSQ